MALGFADEQPNGPLWFSIFLENDGVLLASRAIHCLNVLFKRSVIAVA
jgi:hypothetical protein